jgi:hypothetical protein
MKDLLNIFGYSDINYDSRTGFHVSQGSDYGSGKVQPVGHKGDPKRDVPCLPKHMNKKLDKPS